MKYVISIFLFLFSAFAFGQNWKPIQSDDIYLYYLQGHGFDSTSVCFEAETVLPQGQDTLLVLKRALHPFSPGEYHWSPDFLRRKIKYFTDGSFTCREPGGMLFRPYESLNTSWIFDTTNNINALISSKGISTIFGTADSVETVLLSNGDSVILSESFGIITFTDNGTRYDLAGITGRNAGVQLPNANSIFYSIQPGDIQEYENRFNNYAWPANSPLNSTAYEWVRDSLVAKTISNDTIILTYHRAYADSVIQYNSVHTSWGSDTFQRLYFIDPSNGIDWARCNTTGVLNPGPGFPYYWNSIYYPVNFVSFDTSAQFECRVINFRHWYADYSAYTTGDSMSFSSYYAYPFNPGLAATYGLFGDSIGLIYMYDAQYGDPMGGHYYTWELTYARINGIEYGTPILHVGIHDNPSPEIVKVYPNPASDMVYCANASLSNKIIIRDVSGRVCMVCPMQTPGMIDVSSLAPGIYFLDSGIGSPARFIKQ